jgi:hypothetical protein
MTFDAAYYDRFYESKKTRVQGPKEVAKLATAVVQVVELVHGPIHSVLDVGAGPGLWRDWFAKERPHTAYRSTDVSAYACTRYGHEKRDIAKWRAKKTFDFVVCQGVLPYLDDAKAAAAIDNLAAMTGAVLYLEAVTKRDLATVCDEGATDRAQIGRPASFYKKSLAPHFLQLGLGLWVKRGADIVLYELERLSD